MTLLGVSHRQPLVYIASLEIEPRRLDTEEASFPTQHDLGRIHGRATVQMLQLADTQIGAEQSASAARPIRIATGR